MRLRAALGGRRRRLALELARAAPGDEPRPSYGHDRLPGRHELAYGGMVKFQRLNERFPNEPRRFNLVYLGSNTMPSDWPSLLALARRRGAPLVWNQDGVAYPAWHGPGWERVNEPMAEGLRQAAHVFYQSSFCKLSADRWVGEPGGDWEVLHNAVDTTFFTPADVRPERPLTLMLGGNQYQRYRLETALRAFALVPGSRLLVTGELSWAPGAREEARALERTLGIEGRVEYLGPYAQAEAPSVLRRADVLLHTKVNDPCPSVVIEAMACGLPVAYAASGGVPQLVGAEAGVGVPTPLDWERDVPPAPAELASAVTAIAAELDAFAAAARARAVERFDLEPWLRRHDQVFREVLG